MVAAKRLQNKLSRRIELEQKHLTNARQIELGDYEASYSKMSKRFTEKKLFVNFDSMGRTFVVSVT